MTFVFTQASLRIANGNFGNLAEAGADLRVALVMGANSAVAERDTAEFMADLTLDECDSGGGTPYVRKALASQVLTVDAANNRTELTATATVWTALAAASDDIVGAIVYKHVTNDADSPVIAYYDDGGFPKPATGSDFTVTWSADGLLQVACP